MVKESGVISIYLSKDDMEELDRLANYKRLSRSEWVKERILSILHKRKSSMMPHNLSKRLDDELSASEDRSSNEQGKVELLEEVKS